MFFSSSNNLMLGLSLVVIRNSSKKYIAVKETRNRGWWLPGGRVDPPESFFEAAIREAKEEAGIDIILKGILRFEYSYTKSNIQSFLRFKVIFYAEPKDEKQELKKIPDKESEEARWVTLKELEQMRNIPPFLRGEELLEWGNYLENGGIIFPLEVLSNSINEA